MKMEIMYDIMKYATNRASAEYAPGTKEFYAYRQGILDSAVKLVNMFSDFVHEETMDELLERLNEHS